MNPGLWDPIVRMMSGLGLARSLSQQGLQLMEALSLHLGIEKSVAKSRFGFQN